MAGAHAGDQRDAVPTRPSLAVPGLGRAAAGAGAAARSGAAEVGVDEQHVEPAALGDRTLQTAQRRGTAAGGRDVHVLFRRERGGERLGEDAVVVDHQNPDAYHRDPHVAG